MAMTEKKKGWYCSSVAEDLLLCAAAAYFTGAFYIDRFLPEKITVIIQIAAFALMMLCWLVMSFFNGLRMRKRFIAASVCYLVLPACLYALINNIRALKFSDAGLVISAVTEAVGRFPYYGMEKIIGINGVYISAFTAVFCILLFLTGYIYTKNIVLGSAENQP